MVNTFYENNEVKTSEQLFKLIPERMRSIFENTSSKNSFRDDRVIE